MTKSSLEKNNNRLSLINGRDLEFVKNKVMDLLDEKNSDVLVGDLLPLVKNMLSKRRQFLVLAKKRQTPFYVLDSKELAASISRFKKFFSREIPNLSIYYAVKVNSHPLILRQALKAGFGLDVSSEREFNLALAAKCKKILFTGPVKTAAGYELALKHSQIAKINIDSFVELEQLGSLAAKRRKILKAGVRIFTEDYAKWNKFGIPLDSLKDFWRAARKYKYLQLEGIQFHMSFNRDALPYQQVIAAVAVYLKNNFASQEIGNLKFIDFGGGLRPHRSEGYYPWNMDQGQVIKAVVRHYNRDIKFKQPYFITDSVTVDEYACGIGWAIKKHLAPLGNFEYYTEPGRIICNNAMHVLIRIGDIKPNGVIIADGGNNIIGWERFEYDYFPVINLTHPSLKEKNCLIYGCLCLPEDIWGYYCYTSKMAVGDVLLVPYQGAMTYSNAQNFIRPIPEVYVIK